MATVSVRYIGNDVDTEVPPRVVTGTGGKLFEPALPEARLR